MPTHRLIELQTGEMDEGTVRIVGFVMKIDRQRAPHLAGHIGFARRWHQDGVVPCVRRPQQIGRRGGVYGAAQAPSEAAARGVLRPVALVRL
eukprot:7379927-Prymnesium_polylepis.2